MPSSTNAVGGIAPKARAASPVREDGADEPRSVPSTFMVGMRGSLAIAEGRGPASVAPPAEPDELFLHPVHMEHGGVALLRHRDPVMCTLLARRLAGSASGDARLTSGAFPSRYRARVLRQSTFR